MNNTKEECEEDYPAFVLPTGKTITPCERWTLQLYCDGHDAPAIAKIRNGISAGTVKIQYKKILEKLNAPHMGRAVVIALHYQAIVIRHIDEKVNPEEVEK